MNEDGDSMHHQGSEMHGMHHGMHHQQHEQQTVPEVMVDLALPESMSESNPHQSGHLSHDDMMKMYFYFGYENVQMIIKSWRINSPLDLFWTCLVLFIVTLFHEWLRVWRDNMTTKLICGLQNRYETVRNSTEEGVDGAPSPTTSDSPLVTRKLSPSLREGLSNRLHIILSVSYVLQQFISLCLMLVFMTFNMFLCLTVTLAAGVGYYLFAWRRVVLSGQLVQTSNTDCH
jgi:copper transporter 1